MIDQYAALSRMKNGHQPKQRRHLAAPPLFYR